MSHKKAKQQRRFLRNLLNQLNPIADRALEEVNGNFDMYDKWASVAIGARLLSPQTPLEEFLPNRLDETLSRIRSDMYLNPEQYP